MRLEIIFLVLGRFLCFLIQKKTEAVNQIDRHERSEINLLPDRHPESKTGVNYGRKGGVHYYSLEWVTASLFFEFLRQSPIRNLILSHSTTRFLLIPPSDQSTVWEFPTPLESPRPVTFQMDAFCNDSKHPDEMDIRTQDYVAGFLMITVRVCFFIDYK